MARRRTRGEAQIEALLVQLDPQSERYRVLCAARDFKSSWVELGERLTEVREADQYRAWGYVSFEAYCRQELRIKVETANKLTRSYAFLRDHNPDSIEQRQARELPPLDVVDLLSRARERANLSEAQFAAIEGEVFEGAEPPNRRQVLERFRELDPETFRPPAKVTRTDAEGELRKALLIAERLAALIEPIEDVSKASRDAAKRIVSELRGLFEAARKMSA
jgi:hypothetical protein